MGTCLLNKHQEWRQNDVRMRVERLHKMLEGEYACHLRGVMKYSDQSVCMNILRNKRVIRILCFSDMGNEINFIAYFI